MRDSRIVIFRIFQGRRSYIVGRGNAVIRAYAANESGIEIKKGDQETDFTTIMSVTFRSRC
jgi:hypothetical protein